MLTLGINAAFHDSAAALVHDGVVVAAVEEERFTRIKHAKRPLPFTAWELPYHAIDDCCARPAPRSPRSITSPTATTRPSSSANATRAAPRPSRCPSSRRPSRADPGRTPGIRCSSPTSSTRRGNCATARRSTCRSACAPAGIRGGWAERAWHFVPHHLCHQASAFLAAPFDRCAVMTLDGRGERTTTGYGVYRDNRYRTLGEVRMPHSLGLLYERVTAHLGFLHSSDEYKVMALAALGQPTLRERFQAHRAGRRRWPLHDRAVRRNAGVRPGARPRCAARAAAPRPRGLAAGGARATRCWRWRAGCALPAANVTWRWPAAWP